MQQDFAPGPRGSALVLVDDHRAALASVLLLQEMGFSVDVSMHPEAALSWVRLARYEWVVCSGGEATGDPTFLFRLRYAAPTARVLLIGDTTAPAGSIGAMGIEVLRHPVDVNMLVDRFAQDAA